MKTWIWQGQKITYTTQGDSGSAIILIHGFGANLGHWRKNIPELALNQRVFALDLLGFGGSAKPQDGLYTFETWGQQVADFLREIVQTPTIIVGNSIGSIVALQAAIYCPQLTQGVTLINCSLRLLHQSKRQQIPWLRRESAPLLQKFLSVPAIGQFFFNQIRQPKTIRKILLQAYAQPAAVSDELIDLLIAPSFDPGAWGVFLSFINYDIGPLAEDLLPLVTCPVQILWGELDPWEPIDLGRDYQKFPCVREFIPIANAGHCPQDEVPEVVNPLLSGWAQRCSQANSPVTH